MEERIIKGMWFPIEIWQDTILTWNEKILLIEIDSFTSKDRDCFISNEYIAKLLNITETSANKILSSLIEKGYVEKTSFDGRRRFVRSRIETICKAGLQKEETQGCGLEQGRVAVCDNIPNTYTNNNIPIKKEGTIVPKKELDFKEIISFWNENTKSFPKMRIASSKIKAAINGRIKDGYSVEDIKKAILLCESLPDFYKGKEKGKTWKADFTWLINNTKGNFDKILSGALHNSSSEKREYDMIMNLGNKSYEEVYSPQCDGMTLSWNTHSNAYLCYYEPGTMQFVDGYKDSERPDKATVFRQGIKYSWSKQSNKWVIDNGY